MTIDVNVEPVALDDNAATVDSQSVNIPVLDNDRFLVDVPISVSISQDPANGSVGIANNVVTYTANNGFSGNDSFTYGSGDTATASVAVIVATGTAPVAVADMFEVQAGVSSTLTPLTNDLQLDDTPISLTVSASGNATVTVVDGTIVTYTPNSGFGGVDTFEYTVTDNSGDEATAIATVFVDTQPVAAASSVIVDEGTEIEIDLLLGARGTQNLPLTFVVSSAPANGTFTLTGDLLSYRPKAGFAGSDSITFTILDGDGDAGSAEISI